MNQNNIDQLAEDLGAAYSILNVLLDATQPDNAYTASALSDEYLALMQYAHGYLEHCFKILESLDE